MALNAFQREVQKLAKSKGLKGDDERQVYSTPEYQQLLQTFFGEMQLPAGVDPSQIISRGSGHLEYRDAEGYVHRLERNMDGTSSDLGRVIETSTDRPGVLPVTKQIPGTEDAIQQALKILSGGGSNITAGDRTLLDQITKATLEQLEQQFTKQGGDLIAQLYSRGMNESTLANDAVTRLQQGQGLLRNQALSDAAGRELSLVDSRIKTALELFNSVMGNETTRSVSSGQIGLGREELGQRRIDSDRQFQIEQQKLELQRKAQSPWRSILSAVATLGSAAIPGLGGLGGLLVGGGFGAAGKPPVGGDGGYG